MVTIQLVSAVKRSRPANTFRSCGGGRPARLRGVRDLPHILRPVADEPAKSIFRPGTPLGCGSTG